MSASIGPRIGIDGEAAYRKSMEQIIQQAKTLDSEMKLVASAWDKNTTAEQKAADKSKVLRSEIENQKSKVEALTQQLERCADKTGENSTETQKYKELLNKAKTELNNMQSELDETSDGLDDVGESAENSGEKFSKFKDIIGGIGTALAGIATAAVGAAVSLGKAVVENYAEYEQLTGGVEKLFGDSASTIEEYADRAYLTVGISANEYMEQVTSFSAALISSLGGDTAAAADLADMAMQDMADNANVFGTDIESIQNAYQGFAKQTYTMLDNLKLGYGGTKEEMERLLADAQEISGIEYNIDSYADVVNAIHVIQEAQNIAGTTAQESATTIEGSINSLQASFTNFLTGLGNADADIGQLTQDMATSFVNVFNNIAPIIENIVNALPALIESLMPIIVEMLPTILTTCAELFTAVLNGIVDALPDLIPVIVQAVMIIVQALIDNLPAIMDAGLELIIALADGITENLDKILPAVIECITAITISLIDHLPELIESGIMLTIAIATGIIDALPQLIAKLPEIFEAIKTKFKNTDWAAIGKNIINGIKNGLFNAVQNLYNSIKQIATNVLNKAKSALGIASPSKVFANEVGKFIPEGISLGIDKGVPAMLKDAKAQFSKLGGTVSAGGVTNVGGVQITVNGAQGQDVNELANIVSYKLQYQLNRREAAFS